MVRVQAQLSVVSSAPWLGSERVASWLKHVYEQWLSSWWLPLEGPLPPAIVDSPEEQRQFDFSWADRLRTRLAINVDGRTVSSGGFEKAGLLEQACNRILDRQVDSIELTLSFADRYAPLAPIAGLRTVFHERWLEGCANSVGLFQDARLLGPDWHEAWVEFLCEAAQPLQADSGFVIHDLEAVPLSPYERCVEGPPPVPKVALTPVWLRGYGWGNLLSDQHVATLGGIDAVLGEAPCEQVRRIEGDGRVWAYLQLTDDPMDTPADRLAALRDYLAPLLPRGPERPGPWPRPYRLADPIVPPAP